MKTRTREIAKAGIFGSKDDPQIVTEKDLQEIAETFPELKTAPVQFGHYPDAAAPLLANVTAVTYNRDSQSLVADIEEEDTLADAVDAGYYPSVSIGAKQRASDGKMYLRHLAYLGQEAPAVKDLIAAIKEPLHIAAADTTGVRLFPSPSELNLSDTPPKKEHTVTEQEARKLREENERLKSELKKRDLTLSDAVRQKNEADRERLISAMEGKIPKALHGHFLGLVDAIDPAKVIELSDIDGEKKNLPPLDALVEAISRMPNPVEPGALRLSDLDSEGGTEKHDYSRIRNKG